MSGGGSRRPVSSGSGPPPPRRGGGVAGDGGPEGAAAATTPRAEPVTVPAPGSAVSSGAPPAAGRGREPRRRAREGRAPWWLRLVAWLVAVPLGLALVGVPAREAGYLSGQKLLDIVIGEDLGRYLPLAVIVLAWALVTAILVQVVVEGGNWLLRRRRERRASRSGAGAGA